MDPAVTEWSVRTAGAVECGPLHRLNHSAYVKGLYVFHPISCSKQRQKKKNFFLFHLTTISQLPLVTPTEYLQRKYETKAEI